jgi:hypothetical protein
VVSSTLDINEVYERFAAEAKKLREYESDDDHDPWQRVTCPMLVVSGAEDRITPASWSGKSTKGEE